MKRKTILEFKCICCSKRLDGGEDMTCYIQEQFERLEGPLAVSTLDAIAERKRVSLALWESLPERDATPYSGKKVYRSQGSFRAMSMVEINNTSLGASRAVRSARLSNAAVHDLPDRIFALSKAGINVNDCAAMDVSPASVSSLDEV